MKFITFTLLYVIIELSLSEDPNAHDSNAKTCPPSWKQFGKKCYKIFSNEREGVGNKEFDEARSFCESLPGSLVTIHSQNEQDFLTIYLGQEEVKNRVWIGLEKEFDSSVNYEFMWVDGLSMNSTKYSNFASGEPNGNNHERCVHLDPSEAIAGQWNDVNCDYEMGFVCQFNLTNDSKDSLGISGDPKCPSNFKYYNDICYHIEEDESSWFDSEERCREKYNGHLVSILDFYEQAFVDLLTRDFKKDLWIGLSDTKKETEGLLRWSDGRPIYHSKWASHEPLENKKDHRCVVMSTKKKTWSVHDCKQEKPSICAIHQKTRPDEKHVLGSCASDWIDVGNQYCYYINSVEQENFASAKQNCEDQEHGSNGTLVKFRSYHEFSLLRPTLLKFTEHRFTVGVHEEQYGHYHFVDEDEEASYLPWDKGEPNYRENEKCVELVTFKMKYNNYPCERTKFYICQVDKVLHPNVFIHPAPVGMSSGSAAGVAITVILLIGALAGGVFYYYRKKDLDSKIQAGMVKFQNENAGANNSSFS